MSPDLVNQDVQLPQVAIVSRTSVSRVFRNLAEARDFATTDASVARLQRLAQLTGQSREYCIERQRRVE